MWPETGAPGVGAGSAAEAGRGAGFEIPRLWVRFTDDPLTLLVLAGASLLMAAGAVLACRDQSSTVLWIGRRWWTSVLAGMLGAAIIVLPFVWLYGTLSAWFPSLAPGAHVIPIEERGGVVTAGLLIVLALFSLCGNLVEEMLFRGFLQSHLDDESAGRSDRSRAALLSGLIFALGHLFLAYAITGLGWPVIACTLFEGLVCAAVAVRHGVLGATVAHGAVIFLLSSGLV